MPIHLGTGGIRVDSETDTYVGPYRIYSTVGAQAPYIPYNDGSGPYHTLLFYNTAGYGWIMGRIYTFISISQIHVHIADFDISRYGGTVTMHKDYSYISLSAEMGIGGNANHNGIRVTNTNTMSWANCSYNFIVMVYDVANYNGAFVSGYGGLSDNFTAPNTNTWLQRIQ
jgi:hypothetical protein